MRGLDSLTLRIPLSVCSGVSASLLSESVTIAETTNEEIDRKKTTMIPHEYNGITTKFYIKPVFNEVYLYVTLNSKQLRSRYLEGMNRGNIKEVYNYIMDIGRFYCDFTEFMKSPFHDCDIKADLESPENEWSENLYFRYRTFKNSRLFFHDSTVGLEYGNRSASTHAKPHITYYSKYHELTTNSRTFYDSYLYGYRNEFLRRAETNVKNTAHWRYISKYINLPNVPHELADVLHFNESDLKKILDFNVQLWESDFLSRQKIRKPNPELSANDLVLAELLKFYKGHKMSIEKLLTILDQNYKGGSLSATKSRMRKKLNELIKRPTKKAVSITDVQPDFRDIRDLW